MLESKSAKSNLLCISFIKKQQNIFFQVLAKVIMESQHYVYYTKKSNTHTTPHQLRIVPP